MCPYRCATHQTDGFVRVLQVAGIIWWGLWRVRTGSLRFSADTLLYCQSARQIADGMALCLYAGR
jgi:hypothetical protein